MMYHRYVVEFVGVFLLACVIFMQGDAIPIGIAVAAIVLMGSTISGAHYNPAITLANAANGRMAMDDAFWYVIVQVAGALAALHFVKSARQAQGIVV